MVYLWRAYLDDGSIITEGEYDEYASSEFLPKERVARLEYVPQGKGKNIVGIDIDVENGERFFRVNRVTQPFLLDGTMLPNSVVYVMGVEKEGEKIYSLYLYPDDNVVVSTNHEL